jgi:probable addiction module antidote protein
MGISISKDTKPFDAAEYLTTEVAQAEHLTAALEENDPAFFADAIGVVLRARGMSQLAKKTGLTRDTLYKAFGEGGNPTLDTLFRVLRALGIRLVATPKHHAAE